MKWHVFVSLGLFVFATACAPVAEDIEALATPEQQVIVSFTPTEVVLASTATFTPVVEILSTETPTNLPTPPLMQVSLVGVANFSGKTQISMNIAGLSGEFYGLIGAQEYQCDILFPEQHPERLYCLGAMLPAASQQVLTGYYKDGTQAFVLEFTTPGLQSFAPGTTGENCVSNYVTCYDSRPADYSPPGSICSIATSCYDNCGNLMPD